MRRPLGNMLCGIMRTMTADYVTRYPS